MNWTDIIFSLIAGAAAGVLGGMGLGGGFLITVYLSVVQNNKQIDAQGINLLYYIPTAVSALIFGGQAKKLKKNGPLKEARMITLMLSTAVFAAAGSVLAVFLQNEWLKPIYGCILSAIGAEELLRTFLDIRKR